MNLIRNASQGHFSLVRPLLLALFVAMLVACDNRSTTGEPLPDVLRIGILPDDSEQALRERHTPLFDYLSQELSLTYKFVIPESYADLLERFTRGEIDLAYFGGLTFVKAQQMTGAIPIVMRDIDTRFTSYLITNKKHAGENLNDFKSKTLSFGSKLSTSGHLMPRHFLTKKIGKPETFFGQILYSGSHDATVKNVKDDIAAIGAVNANILDTMYKNGKITRNDIRIISETPPYPNYVWAVPARINQSGRFKLRNAFLSLLPTNERHAAILQSAGANGFLPASNSEFSPLLEIVKESGLLQTSTDN